MLFLVTVIILWNRKKLMKIHGNGVVFSVLKHYFKGYDILMCIAFTDIIFTASISATNSQTINSMYQFVLIFELYIMVALINTKRAVSESVRSKQSLIKKIMRPEYLIFSK